MKKPDCKRFNTTIIPDFNRLLSTYSTTYKNKFYFAPTPSSTYHIHTPFGRFVHLQYSLPILNQNLFNAFERMVFINFFLYYHWSWSYWLHAIFSLPIPFLVQYSELYIWVTRSTVTLGFVYLPAYLNHLNFNITEYHGSTHRFNI